MHSEPAGAAKVIARANPIMLGTGWLACGVGLLIHIRVFEAQGWLNPEAFVGLQETRQAWFYDIAFFGHAVAAGLALVLVVTTFKLALLAVRGFNDVMIKDGRLFYASRPWMGKTATSDIFARIVRSYQEGLIFQHDSIEIVHTTRRRSGRKLRSVRLSPLTHFETAEQVAANLEACGIEIRRRPSAQAEPIWDRSTDG
ncbi:MULTISPECIES: hypothetical protein [unclassified Phenylobacterium]|jgi:hypothetical protein|uniref:hypothetical protein n=1 Tax=unclassified Phenylobacterium TaxID=2640670 RepID=UPI0022B2F779|nr:hypothetical protein [Phenylobacterium sp. NIBR 498073]WGU38786.1 hypothetical protein O4N75_14110 [Phenylobacterium sp. NIBR 498073]